LAEEVDFLVALDSSNKHTFPDLLASFFPPGNWGGQFGVVRATQANVSWVAAL
jgi:hypothetical protein